MSLFIEACPLYCVPFLIFGMTVLSDMFSKMAKVIIGAN